MLTWGLMFKRHGFFDESFWPRYWEDKYWFQSGPERDGYVCAIANRAFAFHTGAATADSRGFDSPSLFAMNQRRFEEKCLERDRKTGETMKAEHHPIPTGS